VWFPVLGAAPALITVLQRVEFVSVAEDFALRGSHVVASAFVDVEIAWVCLIFEAAEKPWCLLVSSFLLCRDLNHLATARASHRDRNDRLPMIVSATTWE